MTVAIWCLLDLGIPPEPESDPVSHLHKREEAEAQAQAHESANLNVWKLWGLKKRSKLL